MHNLLDLARAIRHGLYSTTSLVVYGIQLDIVLHFGLSALIFAVAQPRIGTRRAAWLLAALIIAKEVADIFLKSQVRYIVGNWARAPREILVDIGLDVLSGIIGGLAAWLVIRYRSGRARATASSRATSA